MDFVLDPELAAAAAVFPKTDLSDLTAARQAVRSLISALPRYESTMPLSVSDVRIPGWRGGPEVLARVFAPTEGSAPRPTLLYLHGGAYVLGDLELADSTARMLVDRAGVIVVAVDYRLAPEHPYPAALEDCYAAMQWAGAAAGRPYGIDAERLGVLGESAGGGLAAALALLVRDRGGPQLAAQFLDAPTVDDRLNTPSMTTLVDTPAWQAVNSPYSWRYYLTGTDRPGGTNVPVYAAPGRAAVAELVGLPPTYLTAYEVDPTRDEGLDYGRRLIEAGVPTEIHHYAGAFHMAHSVPGTAIGERMIADRIGAVRRMLKITETSGTVDR